MNNTFPLPLLSTAYLPPVAYFRFLCSSGYALLENRENYQKQSYRNRCCIYSSSGVLPLIVPVVRQSGNKTISQVKIDNSKPWKSIHIKAIISAYRSSPYFEHYFDQLRELLSADHQYLFSMNLSLIRLLISLLEFDCSVILTESYSREFEGIDLREAIHPKRGCYRVEQFETGVKKDGQYHQVFAHKSGFINNLSVLDLLFNEGPQSVLWLKI